MVDVAYSVDGKTLKVDSYPLVDPDGPIPTLSTGPVEPTGLPVDTLLIVRAGAVISLILVVVVVKKRC